MDNAQITTVFAWAIKGFIGALLIVVWYGIKEFIKTVRLRDERAEERENKLNDTILELSTNVAKLSEKFVLKTEYDRDMALLRFMGRRSTDACPKDDCPLLDPRSTHPGS